MKGDDDSEQIKKEQEEIIAEPIQQVEIAEPAKEELAEIEKIPKPERKNWREVKRETEVMAVEDLDGSIRTFEKHVKKLGVAEKDPSGHWIWKGGNKKVVFLGDILGDRNMNGTEITSIIADLNVQAEKQEGQVDHLCGNHDIEFIHFLCMDKGIGYVKKNANHFSGQNIGMWELAQFDPDLNSELKRINPMVKEGSEKIKKKFSYHEKELWTKFYEKIPKILKTMKTDPKGMAILENICNLKLAAIYDDTLFCHTDPTKKMVDDLSKERNIPQRVAEINRIFQKNLRRVLFESGKFDDDFYNLENIYLHTDNREYFVEQKSFEKLAGNLVSNVLENLHKEKKIKFDDKAEDLLEEGGFEGGIGKWSSLLGSHLESINFYKSSLKKNINDWGNAKKIKIDSSKIVAKMLEITISSKKKKQSEDKIFDLFELIEKEIKKSSLDDVEKVKNSGINAIIYGHSSSRKNEQYYNEKGLIIISPHLTIFDGVAEIEKNGKMNFIKKIFRE